jgi:hypothetical protein
MDVTIMAIVLDVRSKYAPKVQEILTQNGCIIKTRLGLHQMQENPCSETGLIILELRGKENEIDNLRKSLLEIPEVRVNLMKV